MRSAATLAQPETRVWSASLAFAEGALLRSEVSSEVLSKVLPEVLSEVFSSEVLSKMR